MIANLEYKYKFNQDEYIYGLGASIDYHSDYIGDYAEKINNLLIHDLDGRYIIERVGDFNNSTLQLIEKEGSLKVKNSVVDDDVKKLILQYYNPLKKVEDKKVILKKFF